jgi:phosphate-selective porin OprO/OprP
LPDVSASTGGSAAPRGPLEPRRTARFNMPGLAYDLPARVRFGPGFQIQTEDSEFQAELHDLTQVDGRFYLQGEQQPVHTTYLLPREWFILAGRLTRPFEFYVAFAQGIDNLSLLDTYFNVNFDPRLQLKIGRYKTPFTYEFYALGINAFPVPERSLFFNNFGLNRDIGLMAYGQLGQNRFDYAVGSFNGTRNGYVDSNDFKDVAGLVNFRPFATRQDSWLESLNVGGSVDFGKQNNLPIPQVMRTNVATTGNLAIGPEFLALNNNVRESGDRGFWSLHLAYYYRHLSLIGEWESGFQDYALANQLQYRTHLPVQSYYVMAGYFLTGETVSGRGVLRPISNFDLRKGKFGLGAFELVGRYNFLHIGQEVFTNGLADANLWTNQLYTTDVGVNWYWSQFIKMYVGWQHAGFGDPVLYAPGKRQLTSDQFWLRWQVYF